MTIYRYPEDHAHQPLILMVPGAPLTEGHWMTRWSRWSADAQILELGLWDEPHRNTWVNKLNLAIQRADRPVVIVTEDIAALALAWWVEFEAVGPENAVTGAIIVNPPDLDLPGADERLARFGAVPRRELPFRSFLVSDLEGSVGRQRSLARLARDWGACPVCDDTRRGFTSGWMLLQTVLGLETKQPAPDAPFVGVLPGNAPGSSLRQ
ncbi:RBBP9/YdeN family alpha/beta hydrolase [Novosphingobium sp. 9]|uniref:RBBP9/YdeN family alpha/beta hydrolase n=1 Tax=Novosphingobium sp. 9 TaxID=2025349 RepID=UPI0021B4E8D8|nr:alpha/beta hydrolase [Novosphingobium sp. 9]